MIEAGTFLQQRYRIDKQIGQGGMGAVYVATDERFGSTVAIKETLYMDEKFQKALEREARLLNSLKHSALPRVSDHFEENNGLFLVMEYIPGDDVGTMLEPGREPFPVDKVMKWADQLLDALDYLHTQEMPVVHRDIKPQNLKVTPRGDIILLDFGLAKGNPTDASHQTAAKSIFGYSRAYASLEQIQGTGTDPRSDLYSLAATLYHLLTNVGPEDALTRAMAVLSQKPDPLVPANNINSTVPRGVAGVLQKAMSLNADERPRSAAEMRQMFRESENYGYLADAATVAGNVGHTGVFSQATQLMPGSTKGTEAQTEVMPSSDSEVTALHAGGAAARTNVVAANFKTATGGKRGGIGVAAGAIGMLLIGALVVAGLYIAKPSMFGAAPVESDKTAETSTVPPLANANTTGDANVSSAQAGSAAAGGESSYKIESTKSSESASKAPETTKNNRSASADTSGRTRLEGEDGTVVEMPSDGRQGDIVVTEKNSDGTTRKTVVKNGMPQIPLGIRAPRPGEVLPDIQNLTKEQMRRMKMYVRRNGQLPPGVKPPLERPEN